MMNFWKKIKQYVFAAVLILAATFAYRAYQAYSLEKQIAHLNASVRFGYSVEEEVAETVLMEELAQYTDCYEDASSDYFARGLENSALIIYRSLLYASDHNYNYIELPADGIKLEDIQKYMGLACLDHAMLEENCTYDMKVGTVSLDVRGNELSRYYAQFSYFTKERMELKEQAYEKARQVVKKLPAGTPEEQARYLYDWVVRSVAYTEDEKYNESAPNYLYDALITGVSNCDGISNTYALLMNLAGLECFNVSNHPKGETEGHTWNIISLDGVYYQVDPTAEVSVYETLGESAYLYFARSAKAMGNGEYYDWAAEEAPACKDTGRDSDGITLTISKKIPTYQEKNDLRQAVRELNRSGDWLVVYSDAFADLEMKDALEQAKKWLEFTPYDLTLWLFDEQYYIIVRK